MGPFLQKTVASFRLLPPTDSYVPPYKDPWRFWWHGYSFCCFIFFTSGLDHVSRSGCLVSACTFSMTDKIRDWVFFGQSTLNQPFWLIKSQMHLKIYITKILGEKCSRICSPHYFFKQGVFCNIRTRLWVFDCWLLLQYFVHVPKIIIINKYFWIRI